jgi:hypothetical protein
MRVRDAGATDLDSLSSQNCIGLRYAFTGYCGLCFAMTAAAAIWTSLSFAASAASRSWASVRQRAAPNPRRPMPFLLGGFWG